jgi:hypothetical protein
MKHDRIDGNTMTITGRTLGENVEQWVSQYGELPEGQDVIRPLENPLKATGHIRYEAMNHLDFQQIIYYHPEFFVEISPLVAQSLKLQGKKALLSLVKLVPLIPRTKWSAL